MDTADSLVACGSANLARVALNNKTFCLKRDGGKNQQARLFSDSIQIQWCMDTHTYTHTCKGGGNIDEGRGREKV